ncbi:hypothetical protein [Arthrobacter dokdonensis]|uniref:hypothetical protein n=1 Tax=Arthrobacter dokdonellae TaxID=2211210 RepID=UPI001013CDE0|nr:hypothetical protein [Arthrobacter dokdonellae]
MNLKDWVTVVASLVIGLGSAFLTNLYSSRRAAKEREAEDRKTARERSHEMNRSLRNYQRVLDDVATDWETYNIYGTKSTIKQSYDDYIELPRAEAYHYFHLFSVEDQRLLKWPILHGEFSDSPPHDPMLPVERLTQAAKILSRYLSSPASTSLTVD